ncbi:hypothetical protein B0H16DRAFT_1469257 [Mycena metata]|uniref:Uncharacterized protein n=1 Tax=Mycena metata TaxID=1033252 RepID=A0AAD7HYH8_9AGAR|nr:hypothetical protein B0H16DRAFT_1469257 [Mycena metata]
MLVGCSRRKPRMRENHSIEDDHSRWKIEAGLQWRPQEKFRDPGSIAGCNNSALGANSDPREMNRVHDRQENLHRLINQSAPELYKTPAGAGCKMSDGDSWLGKASDAASNTGRDSAFWGNTGDSVQHRFQSSFGTFSTGKLKQARVLLKPELLLDNHIQILQRASSADGQGPFQENNGANRYHEKRPRRLSDSVAPNTNHTTREHGEPFRVWILGTSQIRSDGCPVDIPEGGTAPGSNRGTEGTKSVKFERFLRGLEINSWRDDFRCKSGSVYIHEGILRGPSELAGENLIRALNDELAGENITQAHRNYGESLSAPAGTVDIKSFQGFCGTGVAGKKFENVAKTGLLAWA